MSFFDWDFWDIQECRHQSALIKPHPIMLCWKKNHQTMLLLTLSVFLENIPQSLTRTRLPVVEILAVIFVIYLCKSLIMVLQQSRKTT